MARVYSESTKLTFHGDEDMYSPATANAKDNAAISYTRLHNGDEDTTTTLSSPNDVEETKRRKKHNFTVAICMIVKDGEAYFEEWID